MPHDDLESFLATCEDDAVCLPFIKRLAEIVAADFVAIVQVSPEPQPGPSAVLKLWSREYQTTTHSVIISLDTAYCNSWVLEPVSRIEFDLTDPLVFDKVLDWMSLSKLITPGSINALDTVNL